jgi:hypothetical protein
METQPIYDAIESFCDELVARAPDEVTPFLIGRKDRLKRDSLRQSPERFVSENLVWPLLEAVDVDFITEAYLSGYNGQVDFLIQNTSHRVLGECKPFNHYKKAVNDLREYLGHRTTGTEFGIATDGVNWLFIREPGDRRQNVAVLEYHTFRPALFQYFLEDEVVSPSLEGHYVLWNSTVGEYRKYGELRSVDIHESARRFISAFQPRNLDQQLESGAFDRTLDEFSRKSEDSSQENQTLDDFF